VRQRKCAISFNKSLNKKIAQHLIARLQKREEGYSP
jgi:hypothetical protein